MGGCKCGSHWVIVCPECHEYTGQPWVKVEDRKPPGDLYVLVAKYYKHKSHPIGSMYFIQIAKRINDEWFDDHDEELIQPKYGIITHWMPLPDAPKE